MPIPDYQSLMLPVLQAAARGEVRIGDVIEKLADQLALSPDERAELLPSGRQSVFANRVHWAKFYLKHAGLIESPRRAHFKITESGRSVLAATPAKIDNAFLWQFPEFVEFMQRRSSDEPEEPVPVPTSAVQSATKTPDEVMRSAYNQIEDELRSELLERILASPPTFFERVVIKLLVEMGYGGSVVNAGRALGRSGDGGVDGVIDQDALGLDRVYIQAKRYSSGNNVGASAVRDFFGSLDRFRRPKDCSLQPQPSQLTHGRQ
jgi:restriction system protein